MWEGILNFCIKDPQKRQDFQFINVTKLSIVTSTVGLVGFIGYALIYHFYFAYERGFWTTIFMSTAIALSPIAVRVTGRPRSVNALLVFLTISTIGYVCFYTGGSSSSGLTWFVIFPLVGAALGDLRHAAAYLLFLWAIVLPMTWLDLQGYAFPQEIAADKLWMFRATALLGAIGATALLSALFLYSIRTAQQRLIDEKFKYQNLLRTITHDIGNPLAIVYGSVEIIRRLGKVEETVDRRLTHIEKSLSIMISILDNARAVDAFASGKQVLALGPVDLQAVFENCRFLYGDALHRKGIELRSNIPDHPAMVVAEGISLASQVFNNLISNAIKFSDPGSWIEVRVEEHGEQIDLVFQDHGIGMPKNILKNLFNPESRTTRPGTNDERGTGFGMPIVKSYVEKYGGTIEVASVVKTGENSDHGTIIIIHLKKAPADATPAEAKPGAWRLSA